MTAVAEQAQRFSEIFREEHRQVRDSLLDLITAFERRDRDRIGDLLGRVAALTGPHFRYEEESLYPGLTDIFGADYIEKLLVDHDVAIANARRLVELGNSDQLSAEQIEEARKLVRAILPHVSDCDGLSIMVEVIPEASVQDVFDTRERCLAEGLDLLTWASGTRTRPAAV